MQSYVSPAQIQELVQNRIDILNDLITQKKSNLRYAPEGLLRASVSGKKIQYYCRRSTSDKNGTYIKRENTQLALSLAQKEYDQKVLSCASEELCMLGAFLNKAAATWENVYSSLPVLKQKLVSSDYLTDEEFAAAWNAVSYPSRDFSDVKYPFYSKKKEHMRSKSEVLIANLLFDMGIPYRYEYPLNLGGQTVYPDFTVLNVRTREEKIWEHQGMLGDPGYSRDAVAKINRYAKNGYLLGKNLIITQEASDAPLDLNVATLLIQAYLM